MNLTLPGDASPIEKDYRYVCEAMRRCTPADVTFDAKAYDARAVEKARAMWMVRMRAEYRSTAVFTAMSTQAIEANASLAVTAVLLRLAQDEVRHAEICGRTVVALGGVVDEETPIDVQTLSRHPGCGPEERALRNVIYGSCLSEMVNTARFVDTLDTMTDPYLRDVTRQLLADETQHAQFGFHYLDAWSDWLAARPEVLASLGKYLHHAFAVLERQLSGAGAEPRELTLDECALGLPDPARLPESFYATVEGAIVPGLERYGLDAGAAWKNRSLGSSISP